MTNYFALSKFFLFISVLAVAIVSTSTLFPFVVGKYAWFRMSIDLALLFFLFGILLSKDSKIYENRLIYFAKHPLVIALTFFVFIFLFAGFFGVDPRNSFWSNLERGDGGFQMIHLYIFFILLIVLLKENSDWKKIFLWSLGGAFLMALYGVFSGIDIGGFIGPRFNDPLFRFQGSIGNAASVAAYLIFILYYVVYLFLLELKNLKIYKIILFCFCEILFFIFFILTTTRGAFIGLIVSLFAFIGYTLHSQKRARIRLFNGVIFITILLLLIFFLRSSDSIKKNSTPTLLDISFSSRTFQDRILLWEIALSGIQEKPLLGWGPENFIYIFERHFTTKFFNPSEGFGAWYDKAHNIYLDSATETGLIGLISFCALFIVFYYLFFKTNKIISQKITFLSHGEKQWKITRALIFALPIAYLVQGLVFFNTLVIYINLFLFFAFSIFHNQLSIRPVAK